MISKRYNNDFSPPRCEEGYGPTVASLSCRHGVLAIDSASKRSVLHRVRAQTQRSASILRQIAAFCIDGCW